MQIKVSASVIPVGGYIPPNEKEKGERPLRERLFALSS